MNRIVVLLICLFSAITSLAQDLWIYSTNGNVELLEKTSWSIIMDYHKITMSDSLRMADGASVTILDRKNEKLYAIQVAGTYCVRELIENVQSNSKKQSKSVISYLWNTLRGKNNTDEYRHAAGVVYRDDDVNRRIANAVRSGASQIPVSFELLQCSTFSPIGGDTVSIGQTAFFRVFNPSKNDLFVNFIDIDALGNVSSCIPVTPVQQATQLLIPAGSVVILDKFPIRFSEPKGVDTLILVASTQVFDIDSVIRYLAESENATSSTEVGVYQLNVSVR